MVIDLQNVMYKRNGQVVLRDINWQVRPREHWIILGLNGSGKTTLLNLINGYIFPSSGKATVLDYTFGQAIIADLRRSIGWISSSLQQDIPNNETPLDIILSGKFASIGLWDQVSESDVAEAKVILQQLGIQHLEKRSYSSLSQGERQKALIGRALINDPKILIFDEACNGLDIFAKKDLYVQINQLAKAGKTIIFVTHNTEEILPLFEKALLLKDGQIHSQGALNKVIQLDNLKDFYGGDVEVFEHEERFFIFAK